MLSGTGCLKTRLSPFSALYVGFDCCGHLMVFSVKLQSLEKLVETLFLFVLSGTGYFKFL